MKEYDNVDQLLAAMNQAYPDTVEVVSLAIVADAVDEAPQVTSALRNSINADEPKQLASGAFRARYGASVFYAPFVHEGTGIFNRSGEGRQTPWAFPVGNGEYRMTRGQKPNPFFDRAFDKVSPHATEIAIAQFERAFS